MSLVSSAGVAVLILSKTAMHADATKCQSHLYVLLLCIHEPTMGPPQAHVVPQLSNLRDVSAGSW